MSWAAGRHTTRPEDIAYCLLGIFDVNMPLLYGEGKVKAFSRLQEEIMKTSTDQSILAWTPSNSNESDRFGVLAESPIVFSGSANLVPFRRQDEPYSMTNKGLRMQLPVQKNSDIRNRIRAVLSCHRDMDFKGPLCIELVAASSEESNVFVRTAQAPDVVEESALTNVRVETIYIAKTVEDPSGTGLTRFWIRVHADLQQRGGRLDMSVIPADNWDKDTHILQFPTPFGTCAQGAVIFYYYSSSSKSKFGFIFGVRDLGAPGIQVIDNPFTRNVQRLLDKEVSSKAKATTGIENLGMVHANIRAERIMGQSLFIVEVHPYHMVTR